MRVAGSLLVAAGLVLGGLAVPANAQTPAQQTVTQRTDLAPRTEPARTEPAPRTDPAPRPATEATEARHQQDEPLKADVRPPLPATTDQLKQDYDEPAQQQRSLAACDVEGRTGAALVTAVKAADMSCLNGLFSLTGSRARAAFQEPQMVTIANALRDTAAAYPGDNSTKTLQLVLYLRAGYYVQWYYPQDVGQYGAALRTAIRGGLDAFHNNSRSGTVSDANGEVLGEAVILIDSAQENARYLPVVRRLLTAYNSSYDASWYMVNAVNSVYTVLFRGHQLPEFVTAVQNDPSTLTTLRDFAVRHLNLLSTERAYLTGNAGRELARFVQHAQLKATVRPMLRDLLQRSRITGPTAKLWVGVAEMADFYDRANCAFYDICDLQNRLTAAALPVRHTCGPTLRIRAQQMSAAELSGTCSSLSGQDAYFHNLAADNGPVAGDNNTTLEVNAFDSSDDYQTYAGAIFGIDTNNGGMYLEGDPSAAGNLPRFIAYEAEWLRPAFHIWNLNHEYTHYLDGRFNMHGDFGAGVSTPTIWWIEGFAEYVSYGYRRLVYDAAIEEAAKHTYQLSTLFDTTYDHDTQRVYRWGYLAVRYMFEKHRADVNTVLGHYRTGNWNAARTHLRSLNHNAGFDAWLTACAAGACGGDTGEPPVPECTGSDARALGQNCRRSGLSATQGNYAYLYIHVPAGTAKLTIKSDAGTGDADLYYSSSSWATTGSYTQRATGAGNTHTLTVTNPPAGYHYVSLYGTAAFTGAAVTTSF
ncbi:collagenase [Nonomuraea sp. NPDC059023]|uniref:collagenase n=1 Tax=unclassified Nonomuraea TaxID=2593643 RepID=UPI0036B2A0A2